MISILTRYKNPFLAHLLDLRISYLKCNLPKYLVTSILGISIDDFWYKNIFLLPISLLHLTFQRKIMFQAAVITFYFRYDKEIRQIDSAEKKYTKKIIKDILFRRLLVELERYDFLQTAPMVFKAIKKRCKYYLQTSTNQCIFL